LNIKAKKVIGAGLILLAILLLITAAHVPAHAQEGHQTAPFNPQYQNQIGPITLPPYVHLSDLMFAGNTAIGSMPDGNLIYRAADGSLNVLFFSVDTNVPYIQTQTASTEPTPEPETNPTPTPTSTKGGNLRGQMIRLVETARSLVPTFRRLIEKPMMPLLMRVSWILASFILVIAFLRILRENNGASMEFYYWIGRAIFFMFLIGVSTYLVFYLAKAGNFLTIPLNNTTDELQTSFDQKYREFMEGHFTIKDGKQVWVEPMENGQPGLIGILYDKDKKIKDPEEAMDISSWEMPKLFALLSFTRALMEFADFFLIIGGAFIIIFLRMAAPTMCAMGIDQKLAHQATYPYAWTVAGFTLVYPMVREIIRILAYLMGNLALASYDGQPMYWMDERTGQIVTHAGYEPTFTIFIAAFVMLVTALSMFLSPFIAYKFLKGQVFEAVSGVTAGWMASIIGSGVELYGLRAGAALSQQAGTVSAEGQFRSEQTRALGQKDAADLGARSRQIVGVANVQGGLIAALANIRGNQTTQRMIASAGQNFGVSQTRAGVQLSQSDINARRDQSVNQRGIDWRYGAESIAGNSSAEKFDQWKLSPWAISKRNKTANDVNNNSTRESIDNEKTIAGRLSGNQDTYGQQMESAYGDQYNQTVAGVDAGAAIASGGASAGASRSIGGINQGYQLDLKANKTVMDSTIKGAEINRDAQIEAVKLNALNHVVTMFFRDVSRKVEGGLTPRY
jgi:hypothetical protein